MANEKQEFVKVLGAKVSLEKHAEVSKFCEDRQWDRSKFLRRAIDESMEKVLAEENVEEVMTK